MRRKFLKGVLAIVFVALLVGYGISRSVNNSDAELSKLTLANIEALAYSEYSGGSGNILNIFESNRCVCKGGVCSDGAFVSFRQKCGKGDSSSSCASQQYYGNTDISKCN